jgi:hypothetical protein
MPSSSTAIVASTPPGIATHPDAASTITAHDIALPRIYVGQHTSTAVQNGLVPAGSIFAATDAEDTEPILLHEHGSAGAIVYVLQMVKGWSITLDGEFTTYTFDDPLVPEGASLTYNYLALVPDVDLDVPCKWTLSRSGTPTARKINTALMRGGVPAWAHAFLLTTAPRQNEQGKWFAAVATSTDANPEHVKRAGELAALMNMGTDLQPAKVAAIETPAAKQTTDDVDAIQW